MISFRILLEKTGNTFLPKRARPYIRSYLLKAGITKVPYGKFGMLFVLAFFITLLLYFIFSIVFLQGSIIQISSYKFKQNPMTLLIVTFIFWFVSLTLLSFLMILFAKFYYDVKIYKRTKKIEEVLPNFLQSVNANLKAGMTLDKALWNSVEAEFSILEKEIEIVAKKEMTGEDITNALKELVNKYDSQILKESIHLLIVGIEEGSNITDVIDELIKNVKETAYLRKEAVAQVTNYIIFITIIATIISPLLFAFSFNLLVILKGIASKISSSSSLGTLSLFSKEVNFMPENFILFSRLSIAAISIASSFILVNMIRGSIKGGLKYVFIFLIVSFIVYEVSLKLLTSLFAVFGQ